MKKIVEKNLTFKIVKWAYIQNLWSFTIKHHYGGHEIDASTLSVLPDEIRVPILVLHGNQRNTNSVVFLTSITNKSGENVFVPISLDRENGKVSKVATLYGKKNLADYLTRNSSNILAVHKTKANSLFANIRFQLPKSVTDTAVCYDDSIAYTDKNVKPLSEYLTEFSNAKKQENKGEITMPEQAQLEKQSEKDDQQYVEQLERFVKGQIPHFETVSLGHTPPILKYFGAKSEITTIKQNVLRNCLLASDLSANHHSQGHDIPLNTLKQLSGAIRNPVAVLNGQHLGTLVVLTELKNKDDQNIIVPISLDLRSTNCTVNKVTSVYGNDNLLRYLTRHSNDILAVHKEKAEKLFTTIGYQLPQTTSAFCFDNSISYTDKNVKPLSEYLTEFSNAKKQENKGEITMPDLTKSEKDKISRNELEDKAFAEIIEKFKSGKMRSNEVIKVGTTPYALRIAGAGVMPLTLPQSVLKNSIAERKEELSGRNKRKHTAPHALDIDSLKNLPKAIKNPMMICKGNHPGTLVVVLDIKDKKNNELYVSITLGKKNTACKITTILGKKNLDNWINTFI